MCVVKKLKGPFTLSICVDALIGSKHCYRTIHNEHDMGIAPILAFPIRRDLFVRLPYPPI